MNPKVSIIINTYNMEKFIRRSLESALNQSLRDIEILVVDNASTDKTIGIVRSYQEKDSRIKIIAFEKNRGTLQSRIAGGRAAAAEYLCYLDADDRLHQDFCKIMLRTAHKYNVDIVQCSGINEILGENGVVKLERNIALETKVRRKIFQPEIYRQRFSQNIYVVPWGKLIKTTLYQKAINALEIPEDSYLIAAEDEIQTHACCYFAESYIGIKDYLYYYMVRAESETRGSRQVKQNILSNITYLKLFHNFINKYSLNDTYKNEIQYENRLRANYIWQQISEYKINLKGNPISTVAHLLGEDVFALTVQQIDLLDAAKQAICIDFPSNPIRHRKRVAFFLNRLYNGGVERVVSQYIVYLHNMGYEVIVFTSEKQTPNDYDIPKNVERICTGDILEVQLPILKTELERLEIDIVYLAYWDHRNFYPVLMMRLLGCHVIYACHGYLNFIFHIDSPRSMEFLSLMGRLASIVTTVSRTDMISWQAAGIKNTLYVPNPLSFDSLDAGQCAIDGDTLVFVGRIELTKGIYDLIEAFRIVVAFHPKARLIVVGGASYLHDDSSVVKLHRMIEQYKLEGYVTVTGFQKDVLPYLKQASIFCFPTYMDSWGMVYGEAKSVGLPTIVYDFPHLELYSPEDSLLCEVGNISELAEKILYLLREPEVRKKMGAAGRIHLQNFSNERSLAAFQEMLEAFSHNNVDSYIEKKNNEFFGQNRAEWLMRSQKLYYTAAKAYNIITRQQPTASALGLLKNIVNSILPLGSKRRTWMKKIVQYIISKTRAT